MTLTTDALLQLKVFFDSQIQITLQSLKPTDSDRLKRNKINGFLITLQDKLFEIKPKLMCHTCGKAADGNDEAS